MTLRESYLQNHSRRDTEAYVSHAGSTFLLMRAAWLNEHMLSEADVDVRGSVSILLFDTTTHEYVRLNDMRLQLELHYISDKKWLTLHPLHYGPPLFCDCKRRSCAAGVLPVTLDINCNICENDFQRFRVASIHWGKDRTLNLASETLCPITMTSLLYGLPKTAENRD